ncbi:hypothetical protein KY348_06440 [Candidatus Woesearchaeota archaeon]|nr:hypothetical protein [Candidatus Woesearchaeota archaeon]
MHCVVTALLVQDYLGGKIVWARVKMPNGKKVSHYFNRINGKDEDYTREQFPEGTVVPRGRRRKLFRDTREYLLSLKETKIRYKVFEIRFKRFLKEYQKTK